QGDQPKLLELLATVSQAAQESAFIAGLVQSGEIFHPLHLTSEEAYGFLKEVPLYEKAGILCRVPKWWQGAANTLRISVNLGDKRPSHLGADALLDFDAQLSLGDERISAEELKRLLSEAEGLAFIKGKWVEVDHKRLQQMLTAYEEAQRISGQTAMTLVDALHFEINAAKIMGGGEDGTEIEVTHGEWLRAVMNQLTQPMARTEVAVGEDFRAELRAYQRQGVAWLDLMRQLGLGACLADDMGLGKTIQVLALVNAMRRQRPGKVLLVVPASLIGNWLDEMQKFSPSLRCRVLHPSETAKESAGGPSRLEDADILLTTYGMLAKYAWLAEVNWDAFILDEAQAIKNPATKQARSVKRIPAAYKIALTGTPIENRLSDLWSLFDFLNRGLLGTAKEFAEFIKQSQQSPEGYAPLKRVVSPFILRRLKTDPTVISDLPNKIEMKSFAALSKRQTALYADLVSDLRIKLESVDEGIKRKGLILSSLMKFKQICNHPDQYLGQTSFDPGESGKFARLAEICETIYGKRERVLVFTQFKEIAEPLRDFLQTVFHHRGLVLHGETAVAKRRELVAKFQGSDYVPFMVLSLKAGGVGLNLTAANHVIHFDRWWNPAVENQATDRAFRIGQTRNVVVHKFITRGTIEEKIDRLIEEKIQLSQELVPAMQENWINELNNQQLLELLRLSP
ncbi:MAG: DEAD/DEAH box helicase, partial [Thermaerobacter sp.]|nr:DEAD/DEAH box helicase [Thermaerobacter sp.]